MNEDEPRRLKDDTATAPELTRALSALRDEPADAAHLQRVASKLGALLDAAPPSRWSRLVRPATTTLKLVLAGTLLLAPLLWLTRTTPNTAAVRPAPPTPAPLQPAAAEPAAMSGETPSPLPSTVESPAAKPHAARKPIAKSKRSPAAQPLPPPTAADPQPSPPAPALEPAPDSSPTSAPEPSATVSAEPPAAETKPPAASAPRPRPEAQLLFEARKIIHDSPSAALRLLAEHAAGYPNGVLTPEREVLAIEALRKLGRTREADERMRHFQARYPESIHLRRLER